MWIVLYEYLIHMGVLFLVYVGVGEGGTLPRKAAAGAGCERTGRGTFVSHGITKRLRQPVLSDWSPTRKIL